jgi:hypothetical protein
MTNLATTFSRADEDAQPATLEDLLRMVEKLGTEKRMGREWRKLALRISDAVEDLKTMEGLVSEGEVYALGRVWKEHATCKCGDNKHEYRRDAPEARGHWHQTRRDAETELVESKQHHVMWYPNRPTPHLVARLAATTGTEKVG